LILTIFFFEENVMDPNETFKQMLRAYQESNWAEAGELAEALLKWLRIDGFPPSTTVGIPSESLLIEIDDREFNRQIAVALSMTILRLARIRG
jgi:hypothetical protein